jgi:hypothetical protein
MSVVEREEVFVKLTERIDEILAGVPNQVSVTGNQAMTPLHDLHLLSQYSGHEQSALGKQVPVSWAVMQALKVQYETCFANNVPLRSFHKLLLLIRIAPDYLSSCFAAVMPDFPAKIEAWLRRQVAKQLEVESGQLVSPISPDDDQTLNLARRMASEERAVEVDVRHFFLALLADDTSATIKQIREAIGPECFASLVQKARALHFSVEQTNSIVSKLTL